MALDLEKIIEFRTYQSTFYNDSFLLGQGTEHIFEYLLTLDIEGSWIDLGCGTSTLFWSIPMLNKNFVEIFVADYYPEALCVLNEFKQSGDLSQCYQDGLEICGFSRKDFSDFRKKSWNAITLDVFKPWECLPSTLRFNLITQFGCFGVAETAAQFTSAIDYALDHLKVGGYLVGANWKRSLEYVKKQGGDNSFLLTSLIEDYTLTQKNIVLDVNRLLPIEGDELYDYVLLWSLQKK